MYPGPRCAWAYRMVGRGANIEGHQVEISKRGEIIGPDAAPVGLKDCAH